MCTILTLVLITQASISRRIAAKHTELHDKTVDMLRVFPLAAFAESTLPRCIDHADSAARHLYSRAKNTKPY